MTFDDAIDQAKAQAALVARGWGFFQTGPNEGEWLKFTDDSSPPIARQGDTTWAADLAAALKE